MEVKINGHVIPQTLVEFISENPDKIEFSTYESNALFPMENYPFGGGFYDVESMEYVYGQVYFQFNEPESNVYKIYESKLTDKNCLVKIDLSKILVIGDLGDGRLFSLDYSHSESNPAILYFIHTKKLKAWTKVYNSVEELIYKLTQFRFEFKGAPRKVYEIDGESFHTLEEFFNLMTHNLFPEYTDWKLGLDGFNDMLRGDFGTPFEGFILKWKNSEISRERLGYNETVRQLEIRLNECHPANRASVEKDLSLAQSHNGLTVFDWLVEIISDHGPEGDESEDNVELILE